MHKWHSKEKLLEGDQIEAGDSEQTYAKQQLGVTHDETKLLGLHWSKSEDKITVTFPTKLGETTKRGVLQTLASIYDPIGIVSPVTLQGKVFFHELCDAKLSWDQALPDNIARRWKKYTENLPTKMEVARSLCTYREMIDSIELHAFGDASELGTSACVYAVAHQPSGISQGIIAAKSRLAKKDTTIPRLELISSHMAANLLENVKDALANFPVKQTVAWTDSKVALHWIRGEGNYKQYVQNRVKKIRSKDFITWRHIPGEQNPADIGSRGFSASELQESQLWWNGPDWLSNREQWPEDIETAATAESEEEAMKIKETLASTVSEPDSIGELMHRFSYKMVIRITGWILRFKRNCTNREKNYGPLVTEEINAANEIWVKRVQEEVSDDPKFKQHVSQFNLMQDHRGIYVCIGRIQGVYPVYLPMDSKFTEKIVMNAHLTTLHGGVGLTMTRIREHYWIPRLRQLTKKTIRSCFGCKHFQAVALKKPPTASRPAERTIEDRPYQVVGLDFAGSIVYKESEKVCGKAYILLFTCSLTRALCLELLPDQSLELILPTLKRFFARRGRPDKIYSDDFSTFVAASRWLLKKAMRNEKVHDYLSSNNIKWQFNLSRAAWWGGQLERMVGPTKQALFKVVGKTALTWNELIDVLLDVELTRNNRPLSYVGDDVQMPILTPNVMLFGQPNYLPDHDMDDIDDRDLRKRVRLLNTCKMKIWNRWSNECTKGLRERHSLKHHGKTNTLNIGDVMLIKGKEKNRGHWKFGIIQDLIKGRDGIVRGAKLKAGKLTLEQAVQHLYPLELQCDNATVTGTMKLNADAREFRPRHDAAAIATLSMRDQAKEDNQEPLVEW